MFCGNSGNFRHHLSMFCLQAMRLVVRYIVDGTPSNKFVFSVVTLPHVFSTEWWFSKRVQGCQNWSCVYWVLHGWENWRLSSSCPAHGHFSQFPSLWKHISCLRWLSKTKTKLLGHGLAAKYYFHLWLHSRSKKFWSSYTFQKSEGEFLESSELQLVTLGLMIVLCWVGCFSTGPNGEGANFPGPGNSKGTIFLI